MITFVEILSSLLSLLGIFIVPILSLISFYNILISKVKSIPVINEYLTYSYVITMGAFIINSLSLESFRLLPLTLILTLFFSIPIIFLNIKRKISSSFDSSLEHEIDKKKEKIRLQLEKTQKAQTLKNNQSYSAPSSKKTIRLKQHAANTIQPEKTSEPTAGLFHQGVFCPSCRSLNVQFMQNKRKKFSVGKAVTGTILAGPVGSAAGLAGKKGKKNQWRCNSCGKTFYSKR